MFYKVGENVGFVIAHAILLAEEHACRKKRASWLDSNVLKQLARFNLAHFRDPLQQCRRWAGLLAGFEMADVARMDTNASR